jgi:hypothetical protein
MHHFEVLIPNAIDDELGKGHPTPVTHTWLLDFDVLRPSLWLQTTPRVDDLLTARPA